MPIYKTVCKIDDTTNTKGAEHRRLIEAPNMAAAMRYAVKNWITIEVCTTAEAVTLGRDGIVVEVADGN